MTTSRGAINQGGFVLFLAAITLAMVYVVWPFAAPLMWAVLAAIMFQPLYQWFLRHLGHSVNRSAAATMLVITVAVLIPGFVIGSMVVDEAANLVRAFQRGEIDIANWFDQIYRALPVFAQQWLSESGLSDFRLAQDRLQQLLRESAGLIASQALAIGGGIFGFVLSFGVGLYVSYFLIRDGRAIAHRLIHDLPLDTEIGQTLGARFVQIVRATIKGSVVVGLVQGALGGITFWIVGMPSVILFALLMALFSMIPAVGTGIVWVPVAIWLLASGAVWQGLVVIFSGVVVIGLADNILRPILVGRDTGIPDWIVLVTTLGGIAKLGLSGVVLGPLVAGLFLAAWSIVSHQQDSTAASG